MMMNGFRPYRSDHRPANGLTSVCVIANTENVSPIQIPVAPRSSA